MDESVDVCEIVYIDQTLVWNGAFDQLPMPIFTQWLVFRTPPSTDAHFDKYHLPIRVFYWIHCVIDFKRLFHLLGSIPQNSTIH
jgi:hypothetical protein